MDKSWVFSFKGYIKVNMHAFTLEQPMSNENDSRIGVVLRDHRVTIIKMYPSTMHKVSHKACKQIVGYAGGIERGFF